MMAGVEALSNVLEESELDTLDPSVVQKLECHIENQQTQTEEWKAKYERLRVNSEQKYFEIEKQLITSNSQLETESTANVELKQSLAEIEDKFNEASTKLKELQETQEGSLTTQLQLTRSNGQLESEKRDLAVLVEKKNKEIERFNEEWKELNEKLSAANTTKCEAQAKLSEIQSQALAREFKEKRMVQEKEQMQTQLDFLNKELNEKSKELLNFRKEKSARMLEIQAELEEKVEEVRLLRDTLESVKNDNKEKGDKIEKLIQKLKEMRDNQNQADEQCRQELGAQSRLVELYKMSASEADAKVGELTGAVEELQKLLKEAAQAHDDLEQEKQEEVSKFQEELRLKDDKIGKQEQELLNANDLISALKIKEINEDQVESMFPTAAATSKLLKSGMTLTQIYSEYVQATDGLQLEKEENKRLNQYLDQILQEIEEKAPLLKKQREDYETSLHTMDQLTRQLDASLLECQKVRCEADENHRRANHLQRENHRLQQETADLSQQVQHLVREIEELRGGRVVREEEDLSSAEVSSSSHVISEKLVTFRNIQELQEQNQRLLTALRDLSEKQEQDEKEETDNRITELKQQLETSLQELEELTDARNRQAEMVESIVRQRDMYRVLLQQAGTSAELMTPSHTSTPVVGGISKIKTPEKSPDQQKMNEEARVALRELQAEYNTHKKEKAANEKLLTEQIDKARQEASDLRGQNAKLSSQLDYSAERYKVLQGNADSYKKEIAALRDKAQRYSASVVKHEQTISILKEDLMAAQENVARSEVRCSNLQSEKVLLKGSEQRLLHEIESLQRERTSQVSLQASLETIKNNMERAEFETKHRLTKQIETLEREVNLLRKKLGGEDDQHKTAVKHWESQVRGLRSQLELELKNHQQTKSKLTEATENSQDLKQLVSETEAKLVAAESRLANISHSMADGEASRAREQVKDLQSQLNQAKAEIKSLKDQLEKAKQHVNQYKAIADGLQQNMKDQNETSKEFKESLETKTQEAVEAQDRLQKQVDTLEKDRQELLNENIKISEESHTLNADLNKQLLTLQTELQEAVQRRDEAISNETTAKQDSQAQIKIAAEAQDKYERELMLHAADVESLTSIKVQLASFNEKLEKKEEAITQTNQKLKEAQASWAEQEKIIKEENKRFQVRCQSLTEQNRVLHGQMEKLSGQVVAVQKASTSPGRGMAASSTYVGDGDSGKSSEQLLEVIRFLRREKEISETKLEVAQSECTRLKQRYDHTEKQLAEMNKSLSEEREKAQVSVHTAAQHAELMRKVDNLNVVTDSNKLLREERDRLQQQVRELETKVKKLQEEINPLQGTIRDLSARREAEEIEKKTLRGEIERWKGRTNHLIEQANKKDPEEHRKQIQEKEEQRKQLAIVTEESHKFRADSSRLSTNLNNLQRELNTLKQEHNKKSEELTAALKDAEAKTKDVEEKVKTITQLKRIGRKYKDHAEQVGKELEDLKASSNEGNSQEAQQVQANMAAVEEATKTLTDKLGAAERERDDLKQKLTQQEETTAGMTEKITSAEKERDEQKQKIVQHEAGMKSLKDQLEKLQKELEEQKGAQNKLKDENTENEKRLAQSRNVLQSARSKITSQKVDIERLTSENLEFKQKITSQNQTEKATSAELEQRISVVRSQYEDQIQRLEQELNEARKSITTLSSQSQEQTVEKLLKENSEIQSKVQQLEKQLESQQQKLVSPQPQVHVSRPSITASVASRTSVAPPEAPKTANIKPLAPSPAAVRPQGAPIQPLTAAAKATASIRPMAIPPTTVAPLSVTMATPTATVMPTTVSQPDSQEDESPSASQVSPATPTARVTPQESSQGQEPVVEPVMEPVQVVIETPLVVEQQAPSTSSPSPSGTATSREPPQPGKRQREEAEGHDEAETQMKRTKTTEVFNWVTLQQQQQEQQTVIPGITVTNEDAQTTTVSPVTVQTSQESVESQQEAAEGQQTTESEQQTTETEEVTGAHGVKDDWATKVTEASAEVVEIKPSDAGGEEIIIVESDEEQEEEGSETAEEVYEEEEEEEEGGEGDEDMQEYEESEDDDVNEGDYQEGEGEMEEEEYSGAEQEDDMQAETGQDDDDDDIVIVEDDGQVQMEAQEEGEGATPSQSGAPSLSQAPMIGQRPQPITARTERLPSASRAQLTPFVIGGQPPFEEGEDCTVPSTPTLFVPRRGDGFAEAVSSPQIPQRFIFTSGADSGGSQPELAQLESQRALGMDDTKMDLTQFDEGGGRSVPTTPLRTTPPVTVISDVAESLLAQRETTPAATSSEGSVVHITEADTGEVQPAEEADDEGEEIFEGDQGEDDTPEDDDIEQETGEASLGQESGDSPGHGEVVAREQGDTGAADKDEEDKPSSFQQAADIAGGPKPRIQRITWGGESSGQPGTAGPPVVQESQSTQQAQPFRGQARGHPQYARGRGYYPRSRGASPRGAPRGRNMRGSRGGMFRPPMY